jgi:thiol-disulfide isomerase/thioredoxin
MSEELNSNRRRFLAAAAMTVAAVPFGVTGCAVQTLTGAPGQLPDEGELPSLGGASAWLNSQPLTAASLRGRVVLVQFGTYTCINWLRTLPHVRAWAEKYGGRGLAVAGVHTPEFAFERHAGNVERAIAQNDLGYAVAQDNEYDTWNAWGNQYWPAKYLIDARGRVRYAHFGEGDYDKTEAAIRALLAEAGESRLGATARARVEVASRDLATPETYLNYERAQSFDPPLRPGTGSYAGTDDLPPAHFSLSGTWKISSDAATAVSEGEIHARVTARKVFLVLGTSDRRPRRVDVLLDGKPVPGRLAGEDVSRGRLTVTEQRLYRLVSLPAVEDRRVTLKLTPGVSAYAFTFG